MEENENHEVHTLLKAGVKNDLKKETTRSLFEINFRDRVVSFLNPLNISI